MGSGCGRGRGGRARTGGIGGGGSGHVTSRIASARLALHALEVVAIGVEDETRVLQLPNRSQGVWYRLLAECVQTIAKQLQSILRSL